MFNCPQLTKDLQALKDTFGILKNELAEFEYINSSKDFSRAEKIAKLKELYQIRKKLQEIYPPLQIMKAWAEKYLTTHKTSRKIAQTKEQALTGKYLIYLYDINCRNMESAESLKFPKIIGGTLDLLSLTSTEYLKLPDTIGGSLNLYSFISAEHLNLPDTIGGSLYLNGLTSAKHLKLPDAIGVGLNLYSLISAEHLKLPNIIGGSLYLNSLISAEHLKLPDNIGRDLDLSSLTSTEHLDLINKKISGYIYLNSLTQEEFEKLQEQYPDLKFIR